MALKTTLDMVTSNWCQPIAGLTVSPTQFYEAVIKAVGERKIPDIEFSRVWWKETSFVGAKREYLRVQRGRYVYDICAAPYGNGSFISSWLCIVPFRLSAWHLAGNFASMILLSWLFPVSMFLFCTLLFTGAIWWMYHRAVVATSIKSDFLLGMTGAGPFLKALSEAKPTYYQLDAAGIFQTAVQEAVMGVIDGLCETQNLRALGELERKPMALEFRKK